MVHGLRGSAVLVDSRRNMGEGIPVGAASKNLVPSRLGANPPDALVDLRGRVTLVVLAACGIPPEVMSEQG